MTFADLIAQIRRDRGLDREVPGFDPQNGNEQAWLLLLLEAPGPRAVQSGFVSFDNPDPTARNLKEQLAAAGIGRADLAIWRSGDLAIWNIVPWYIGNATGTAIRAAAGPDVLAGVEYLPSLLSAMPRLRCIALVGSAARQAHVFLSRTTPARIVSCHHPSARVLNSNPHAASENIAVFRYVRETVAPD